MKKLRYNFGINSFIYCIVILNSKLNSMHIVYYLCDNGFPGWFVIINGHLIIYRLGRHCRI